VLVSSLVGEKLRGSLANFCAEESQIIDVIREKVKTCDAPRLANRLPAGQARLAILRTEGHCVIAPLSPPRIWPAIDVTDPPTLLAETAPDPTAGHSQKQPAAASFPCRPADAQ